MTDLEKLSSLLTDFGVKYEEISLRNGSRIFIESGSIVDGKVRGFCGFITEFHFDGVGNFDNIGIWE